MCMHEKVAAYNQLLMSLVCTGADTAAHTQAAHSTHAHTERQMTDLEDDDHVEVAQVEANPFQVDNGNSRHGYDCGWGLNKLN